MERKILVEELNKISLIAFGDRVEIYESVTDDSIILRFVIGDSIFYNDKNERIKVPITNKRRLSLREARAYITAFNRIEK